MNGFRSPSQPANPARQQDAPVIPVRLPKLETYENVQIDSNRLRGSAVLDLTADRALAPDAGLIGLLARFLAVSGATAGLCNVATMSLPLAVFAVLVYLPVASLTALVLRNRGEHNRALAWWYFAATVAGFAIFCTPVIDRTVQQYTSPVEQVKP
jgi:branched-subunit amino acid transport protein